MTQDPNEVVREARERFAETFARQCDSLSPPAGRVSAQPLGAEAAVQLLHRMAGLGGTVGFRRVSAKAAEFEEGLRSGVMDDDARRDATAGLRAAFASDVARPAPAADDSPRLLRITPPMTVLLVEDEPVQRAIMSAQLRALGHTAVAVASGEAALEAVRTARPDVILLDIELPGMTGYAVCHALKADPGVAAIPVAFLSARASAVDRVTGLSMGADDFMTKPLDPYELELRLMHLDRRVKTPST